VGGKAQLPIYHSITANLKLAYSQFEELENYARFGTRMDEHTKKIIEHGKRIRIWLKQQELQSMSVPEQIVVLLALTSGLFENIPINKMQDAETALLKSTTEIDAEILKRLFSDKELSSSDSVAILKFAGDILIPFQDKKTESDNKSESGEQAETNQKQK